MVVLSDIQKPIERYLLEFNEMYSNVVQSDIRLLNDMALHINHTKGKQIRPTFTYLSGLLCGEVTEQTSRAALAFELFHTSTLIHDDVVDDSHFRRGVHTLNEEWSNKLAVLFGDYLLSLVLRILSENNDFSILKIISRVATEMSEGEILQQQVSFKQDYSEKSYLEVIRKKTATLLTACFEGGALSVNSDFEKISLLKEIGESVGMAFQIKDDLMDYMPQLKTGKQSGNDIRERKFTLPLIGYLQTESFTEQESVLKTFASDTPISEGFIEDLIRKVNLSKGMLYAKNKMNEYVTSALERLEAFPESDARSSLKNAILYTTERNL